MVVALAALVAGTAAASTQTRATGDSSSRPRTPIPAFVLDRGRVTRFDHPGAATETAAGSIDDRGRIVGGYYDASGATHGFLRDTRGRFKTIDVPGAKGTTTARINDRGQIVGRYTDTPSVQDPTATNRGYLLDGGRLVRLDPPAARSSQAVGLNNRGTVVGEYRDAAGAYHGYVWRMGRFRTVDMPGATATSLVDVNDRGTILGSYLDDAGRFRGFVLSNSGYRTVDAPEAAYLFPRDINNRVQIAGFTLDDLDLTGARVRAREGRRRAVDSDRRPRCAPEPRLRPQRPRRDRRGVREHGRDANCSGSPRGAGRTASRASARPCGHEAAMTARTLNPWLLTVASAVVLAALSAQPALADPPPAAAGGTIHGFVAERGLLNAIDHPEAATIPSTPDGQTGTATSGINDRGQILGAYEGRDRVVRHFVRDRRSRFVVIDDPPGTSGDGLSYEAVDIKNRGEIVGFYNDDQGFTTTGFLRTRKGRFADIDVPGSRAGW